MTEKVLSLVKQAQLELKNDQISAASECFEQALAVDPKCVDALYGLGLLQSQASRYAEAYHNFKLAAELEPESADIAYNLGFVLAQTGNRSPALLEFQRASKYCSSEPELCSALAEAFVAFKEPKAALQVLDMLDALQPRDQITMAKAYGLQTLWSESTRVLYRLSQDLPEDVSVLGELAKSAANQRDYRVAIDTFEKLLKLKTPSSYDYVKFADLLLLARHTERAGQALEIAEKSGEKSVSLYVLKAKLARLEQNHESALSEIGKALDLAPLDGEARYLQAELVDDQSVASIASELSEAMQQQEEFEKLSFHARSLFFFGAAKLAERDNKLELAADYFYQANKIRAGERKLLQLSYDLEAATKRASLIKQQYNQDVMASDVKASPEPSLKLEPIFIVGMPRSGTTLVEKILSGHKHVQALGEQEAMVFIASDYQYYIASGAVEQPSELAAEQWQRMRQTYLDKVSDLSQRTFTDKMPHNFENVGLILKLFPDAKVIQVRRNAKDVALSVYQHPFPLSHRYASSVEDALHAVSAADGLMDYWSSLNLEQVFDLDYQNLVNEPVKYARELTEFCGLSWSEELLQPLNSDQKFYTFSELQVRKSIDSSRVDRWQKYADYIPAFSS